MSMKAETLFQTRVLRELRELPKSWWEKISQRTVHGTPDILGCVNGKFVALELKADSGRADPLQLLKIEKINKAEGYGVVVYPHNFAEVVKKLWSFIEDERSTTFCISKNVLNVGGASRGHHKKESQS